MVKKTEIEQLLELFRNKQKKLSNVYSENVYSGDVLKISFLFYLLII